MSIALYDVSIPYYLRMMRNLVHILEKGEAHAREAGVGLATYAEARLAPDMANLIQQVQMVSDSAKNGAARLAAIAPPKMPDEERTYDELKERLAKTIAFVETIKPEQVNGREGATVELPLPDRTLTFKALDFLFGFSIPNFTFHVTTAYGILRNQGVPVGKLDYLTGGAPAF